MIQFSFGIEFSFSVMSWYWFYLISHLYYDIINVLAVNYHFNLIFSSILCTPTPTKGNISVNDDSILWLLRSNFGVILDSSFPSHPKPCRLHLRNLFLSCIPPLPPPNLSQLILPSLLPLRSQVIIIFCPLLK